MKAQIVPTYVFIQEEDFLRNEIINDDIIFRLECLVGDTIMTADALQTIQQQKDEQYDF